MDDDEGKDIVKLLERQNTLNEKVGDLVDYLRNGKFKDQLTTAFTSSINKLVEKETEEERRISKMQNAINWMRYVSLGIIGLLATVDLYLVFLLMEKISR